MRREGMRGREAVLGGAALGFEGAGGFALGFGRGVGVGAGGHGWVGLFGLGVRGGWWWMSEEIVQGRCW